MKIGLILPKFREFVINNDVMKMAADKLTFLHFLNVH